MASSSTPVQLSPGTGSMTDPKPVLSKPSPTLQIRAYVKKRRAYICIAIVIVILAMILTLIFSARHYYLQMVSSGSLRRRQELAQQPPILALPIVQTRDENRWRANVPYYTCGDQLHSCEAYNQPNICCPVHTYCHPTIFSPSGIFCCNTTSASGCHSSHQNAPQCPENTIQCSKLSHGGCCPQDTICTPNGCVKITSASLLDPQPTSYSSAIMLDDGTTATHTGIVSVPLTERPAATSTGIKIGEVAQAGSAQRNPVFFSLCLPYLSASMIVVTALVMGYL